MIPLAPPKLIRVVTDGRPGNENPALGLAEALAARTGATVETARITLRPGLSALPAAIWARRLGPGWPFSGLSRGAEGLRDPADLVIGAGRRSAPIVAALRGPGRAAIQLMNPQMPLARFDAVIAPEHDGLRGANVMSSLGSLTRLSAARTAAAAAALPPEWRPEGPTLAAMIGGPSGAATFTDAEAEALLSALARARAQGFAPLLIPSRRTPPALIDRLKAAFPDAPIHTGDGPNPYPGVLGVAAAALVTADSVNMCSEAASTGLPLFILPVPGLSPKLQRFHAALAARTGARAPDDFTAAWTYPPLDEAGRIADALLARA
ncbi:mitochondrial fission ELM1 family protein [Rhodovulum sp. DZ06]|uniref:mitochondrial fission ELM1 family protein n=1 Tax=Rhodovulum sp. DZ06 TaxID=3425126 RepID=UPI003D33E495